MEITKNTKVADILAARIHRIPLDELLTKLRTAVAIKEARS